MAQSPWTTERVELLKILWAQGKTAQEISRGFKGIVSRNAVISKAHRLKLPSRPSPLAEKKA